MSSVNNQPDPDIERLISVIEAGSDVLVIQYNPGYDPGDSNHLINILYLHGICVSVLACSAASTLNVLKSASAIKNVEIYSDRLNYFQLLFFLLRRKHDAVILYKTTNRIEHHLPHYLAYLISRGAQKFIIVHDKGNEAKIVPGKFILRSNAFILSRMFLLVLQKPFIYIKNAAIRTFCRYDPKKIRKILFVRLDHIGDAVMSLALVDILRSNFPSAAIHVLAAPWNFEIFHRDSRIDKVYSFSALWHKRKNGCFEERNLNAGFELIVQNSQLINSLKSEVYDLAIDSRGDLFDSLMAYESGARFVIGSVGWFYNTTIFDNSFLLTHVVDYGDTMKHISALHADIAEKLECKFSRTQLIPTIFVSKSDQDNIRKIFWDLGIDISDLNKINIAFQICAGEKSRQWPKENFEELALRIGEIYGNKVNLFFSGSSSEKDANQELCEKLSSKGAFDVYNIAGTFSLADLPAFFKEMDLLITNDTGPMHIANAVGVKMIALFKKFFVKVHAPVGSNNVIISTKRDSDDMSTITVLEVIDAVIKSIK